MKNIYALVMFLLLSSSAFAGNEVAIFSCSDFTPKNEIGYVVVSMAEEGLQQPQIKVQFMSSMAQGETSRSYSNQILESFVSNSEDRLFILFEPGGLKGSRQVKALMLKDKYGKVLFRINDSYFYSSIGVMGKGARAFEAECIALPNL